MAFPYIFKEGCDLVKVERFVRILEDNNLALLVKFLRKEELEALEQRYQMRFEDLKALKNLQPLAKSLAARFAAKEAVLKALGTGLAQGFSFQDIEIQGGLGKPPFFAFYGKVKQYMLEQHLCEHSLSLSHDGDYALATCTLIFEKNKKR